MKIPYLIPFAALVLFAATGCDKQSSEVANKIAELEQKNQDAVDRQRELEHELEDQKLAAERDAIERERVKIEDDRAELERQQGTAAAEQDQTLRDRAEALSNREGKLEQFQSALEEKADDLHEQTQQLSERDRELAGREALAFEQPAQSAPVADYGMFYDSLSSYGSWFETPDYGYVWQPAVVSDSNWRPYCRGRWACSDRGWTWVSEEPFGWATYHYGRWTLLRGRSWIWVPGTEWAPCWVSWRENASHIGWAPLPPETLAYRGHNWDSSVDVQFSIGALCYNFVELRYFGSSLYNYCLPTSANGGYFQQTSNITYIHIESGQVICGGPKYKDVCKGTGRDLPFYRLEIDQHPRPSRDSLAMRPRIKGDRLVVSAPNMDVAWNDGLRPKRIKDRIETVTVERNGNLGREISDRYRQTRDEGRQKAETSIVELGGADQFDQRREEKLQDNRRLAEGKGRKGVTRGLEPPPERPQRDIPNIREPERVAPPADPNPNPKTAQVPDRIVRQPNENRPRPEIVDDRRNPAIKDTPRVTPPEVVKPRPEPRPQQPADDRRIARTNDSTKQMQTQREPQRQADPAAIARKEAADRRQDEQARQAQQDMIKRKQDEQAQQQQLRAQREAEQAREAQKEVVRQQHAQRQQQELAQQREQERAQRQLQDDQQRDMQRRQEERQQQQEQTRQRQQEEGQRQQDNARQRQQEENQRQRQQDDSRQKQEKDAKDQDDRRKRNR